MEEPIETKKRTKKIRQEWNFGTYCAQLWSLKEVLYIKVRYSTKLDMHKGHKLYNVHTSNLTFYTTLCRQQAKLHSVGTGLHNTSKEE